MIGSLSRDTLSYQLGVRPGLCHRNMASRPLPAVVGALTEFLESKTIGDFVGFPFSEAPCGSSERDAAIFYLLNHAVAMVRQQVHPLAALGGYQSILDDYHTQLTARAARMFFYMLLICTRESRHDKTSYTSPMWSDWAKKHGSAVMAFHKIIKGCGSLEAARRFQDHPPGVSLGAYTSFLVDIFYQGQYSGGYGGKAWGKVADVLSGYVHGTLTAEMMMDTSFTLAHNNGPIFNKGMLFEAYSQEIYTLLDVQRSGQMPQLIGSKATKWALDAAVEEVWDRCYARLGTAFEGNVDWFAVEALGAVKNYSTKQAAQVAAFGYPPGYGPKAQKTKPVASFTPDPKPSAYSKAILKILPWLEEPKAQVKRP